MMQCVSHYVSFITLFMLESERLLLRKSKRIVEGSSRKSATKDEGSSSSETGLQQQQQKIGRPPGRPPAVAGVRSTDVHNVHKDGARSTTRPTD